MIQGQFYTTIKVQQPYNKAVFFLFYIQIPGKNEFELVIELKLTIKNLPLCE